MNFYYSNLEKENGSSNLSHLIVNCLFYHFKGQILYELLLQQLSTIKLTKTKKKLQGILLRYNSFGQKN